MNASPIRFHHRGRLVEVTGAATTRTVLDWLREDAHCTGTKEGCNEGDCGACTVVIGELPEHTDAALAGPGVVVRGLSLRPVNACLRLLPTLHGKALFTVEDLKAIAGGAAAPVAAPVPAAPLAVTGPPHPVQRALVECHGSQCGFCTPGFAMSLYAAYEHHLASGTRPTRQQLADELAGNLCRCTGYRPILDAGQRMFDLPQVRLDTAPVIEALRALRDETCFEYAVAHAQGSSDDGGAGPSRRIDRFLAPRSLDDLARLRLELPQARLLAGATDIGLWINKQHRDVGDLLYLGDVAALKTIGDEQGTLRIGAGASLESAWRALAVRHPVLTDLWLRFASPPVRHAGTLGGNIANGSPIGDGAPVLMALDARIELRRGERVRELPLAGFYTGYMQNLLEPGEFVQALQVPPAPAGLQLRAYKLSRRFDSDISAVCAALAVQCDDAGVVRHVRLAYGGMAATVALATHAQQVLLGQPWSRDSVTAAMAALREDFQPLSDMRGSAAYRMQAAGNLLLRFWLETRADDPLPPQSTSVFAVMPHAPAQLAPATQGGDAPETLM